MTKRRRRYIAGFLTGFLILGTAVFMARRQILIAAGDFLVVHDSLQPADIIHVVAGHDHRTDYAVSLYKKGYGRYLFFTGGWCPDLGEYHGEHGRERAIHLGVPSERIATDDSHVTSTYSEVIRLRELIARSPSTIRSVIVVSDPFHMRRARWTYDLLLGRTIRIQMAPVPFDSGYRRSWWVDETSRRYVGNEYLKFAYYLARYKFAFGPLRGWLARFDRG